MKRLITIALVISTLFACCACQPTPKGSSVMRKNDKEFYEALGANPQDAILNVPESINEKYDAKTKGVTIEIDASVRIPDGLTRIAAYHVVPAYVDNTVIKNYVDYFFGDAEVTDPISTITKDDIKAKIKWCEEMMTDKHLDGLTTNPQERKILFDEYKKQYDMYLQLYNSFHDNDIKMRKSDLMLKPYKYYVSDDAIELFKEYSSGNESILKSDKKTVFVCNGNLENGYRGQLVLRNPITGSNSIYSIITEYYFAKAKTYMFADGRGFSTPIPIYQWGKECSSEKHTISEEKARETATAFIKDCIKEDFQISKLYEVDNGAGQKVYEIYFSRDFDGLEIADRPKFTSSEMNDVISEQELYMRASYGDELLMIAVTDEGIVYFDYGYPLKIDREINKGVAVKSFDVVLDVFRSQSALTYDNVIGYDEDLTDAEKLTPIYAQSSNVRITSIELKLIRLAEKDSELSYILAPVWVFSGNQTFDNNESSMDVTMYINAIDGSIISAEDCY